MTTYRLSNNTRLSKQIIDRKISEAKNYVRAKQNLEHGYNFCVKCGINDRHSIIDCSHIVSVDDCQKNSKTELAWDTNNIEMLCRKCHDEWHVEKHKK